MMDGDGRPRRPTNRRSFTYRIYCDLVAEAKNGMRRKLAINAVAGQYGINRKIVARVWHRFVRPHMLAAHGRARELF